MARRADLSGALYEEKCQKTSVNDSRHARNPGTTGVLSDRDRANCPTFRTVFVCVHTLGSTAGRSRITRRPDFRRRPVTTVGGRVARSRSSPCRRCRESSGKAAAVPGESGPCCLLGTLVARFPPGRIRSTDQCVKRKVRLLESTTGMLPGVGRRRSCPGEPGHGRRPRDAAAFEEHQTLIGESRPCRIKLRTQGFHRFGHDG